MTRAEALRQLCQASDSLRAVACGSFATSTEARWLIETKRDIDALAALMAEREEVAGD